MSGKLIFPDVLLEEPSRSPERSTALSEAPREPRRAVIQTDSDERLLEHVRDGDKDALAQLFRRYTRMVRSVTYRIVRNDAEADDLVQEVFLFVCRKASLFDPVRGTARSWIVQVTYHRAIDRRRQLASRHFYSAACLDDPDLGIELRAAETIFYEKTTEGTLGSGLLEQIKESLPADQRETLELYFFSGLSFDEIAQQKGQTLGNVRNHYYRALEKIRKLIFGRGSRDGDEGQNT